MSPSAMKQMSCESGLSATASPRSRRLVAHLLLGRVAEREHRPVELLAGQHGQHVRLVLGQVDAAPQQAVGAEPGVVTGDDRVEAQRHRPVQHRRELDLLVAAQARVGRAAGGVLGDEVVDHVLVEPVGHVPDVERDADHVGGAPRVARVLERAAAARAGAVGLRVARQRQVHAGDVVPGVDRPSGRDGRVDPTGHRCQNPHGRKRTRALQRARLLITPARRARSTAAGQRGDAARRRRPGRGVAEREAQRGAGPVVVGAHRQQHVRRLGHAGRAGRAGGAGDALRVEQQQQRVALAAGEARSGRCRAAGRPGRR